MGEVIDLELVRLKRQAQQRLAEAASRADRVRWLRWNAIASQLKTYNWEEMRWKLKSSSN